MAAKNYTQYYGPIQTGFIYYTKNGNSWDKNMVRGRLTIGTRMYGITMQNTETPEEFKEYQQSMATLRKRGFIYVKEE